MLRGFFVDRAATPPRRGGERLDAIIRQLPSQRFAGTYGEAGAGRCSMDDCEPGLGRTFRRISTYGRNAPRCTALDQSSEARQDDSPALSGDTGRENTFRLHA